MLRAVQPTRSSLVLVNGIRARGDNVRFGSQADISACVGHVRFTPESGHTAGCTKCPLSAKSGHQSIPAERSLILLGYPSTGTAEI